MPENPFEKLLVKKIYEILDGDTSFGDYELRNGKKIEIRMPYLSGPVLCEVSTMFDHIETYNWHGANKSRWRYVEDLLKHCIDNNNCSKLLEFFFSFSRFQTSFSELFKDEITDAYSETVKRAILGINSQLMFSDSKLVFRDKRFQIVSLNNKTLSIEDTMSAIFKENSHDSFSSTYDYEQCESIGRGGFGEVYRYHNNSLDMDFAVKIYRPLFMTDQEREDGEKRFFREARILFSLDNQNVVRIYDAGRIDGNPFIRMEYLDGQTLEAFRHYKGPFDVKDAVGAAIQILEALECAHDSGIIHRDLKPSNIMVIRGKGRYICKVIDFGVSAFMETEGYTKLTRTGEHIAGGQYIDPNLQDNPKLRDIRSDIYSVAAILYFLLVGRAPIGSDIRENLHKAKSIISPELESIILNNLSLDVSNRFNNCTEFIKSLKPFKQD